MCIRDRVLHCMLSFFEKLINPFPVEEPNQPPSTLFSYCRHHIKGMEIPLLLMAVFSALLAVAEVFLFGFMGDMVDWLSTETPATLFDVHGDALVKAAVLLLIGLPVLVILHAAFLHLALLGNFPMQIRWMSHRYLLKQSMSFYQNDFAGRIATKVMQTSLAVRETVMKLLDVMVYVGVYAISILVLVAQADYRLMIPIIGWLFSYSAVLYFFIPRLKRISTDQADARAEMTGRVVDSYTNIATVKLFSHSQREASYAKEGMNGFLQTVYKQMRFATGLSFCVNAINYLLTVSYTHLTLPTKA